MANFNGVLDLMKLWGAKYLSGIDTANPNRAYICVPVDWNEIKVVADAKSKTGVRSTLKLGMYSYPDNYIKTCKEEAMQRGENMDKFSAPSHKCQLRYSKQYHDELRAKAKKEVLDEHLEWTTDKDLDETKNSKLRNEIFDRVDRKIGSFYVNHPMSQSPMPPMESSSGFSQAPIPADGENQGTGNPDDDLPF